MDGAVINPYCIIPEDSFTTGVLANPFARTKPKTFWFSTLPMDDGSIRWETLTNTKKRDKSVVPIELNERIGHFEAFAGNERGRFQIVVTYLGRAAEVPGEAAIAADGVEESKHKDRLQKNKLELVTQSNKKLLESVAKNKEHVEHQKKLVAALPPGADGNVKESGSEETEAMKQKRYLQQVEEKKGVLKQQARDRHLVDMESEIEHGAQVVVHAKNNYQEQSQFPNNPHHPTPHDPYNQHPYFQDHIDYGNALEIEKRKREDAEHKLLEIQHAEMDRQSREQVMQHDTRERLPKIQPHQGEKDTRRFSYVPAPPPVMPGYTLPPLRNPPRNVYARDGFRRESGQDGFARSYHDNT